MTDNEIKQALECCNTKLEDYQCPHCPLLHKGCKKALVQNALDLINRLQAENKTFSEIIKKQDDEISSLRKNLLSKQNLEEGFSKSVKQFEKKLLRTVELTKAEAYKECIEKVKEKSKKTEIVCSGALVTMSYAISNKNLNNLLKELEGEDK